MALETVQQINQKRLSRPTHIFLQAGVGAMSAALTAFFANYYKDTTDRPRIIIVEADTAECLYNTMRANDGTLHHIHGKMKTMMAGLACGEPCTIAWGILKDYADYFTVIRDEIAADGMRVLANPIGNDPRIISGESGAAAFGLVFRLLSSPQYKHIREQLHLDENSSILCFSTEGATDLSNYRNIIWHGANRAIERN